MVSKLAAALVAPLLIAIVWPAPAPIGKQNPSELAPRAGAVATSVTPNSAQPSSRTGGDNLKILDASQAIETFRPGTHRMPFLTRNGARNAESNSGAPTAQNPAARTATTTAPPKVALYNNLNNVGINATSNGSNQGSPPDSTGAIGPNHYVEMANSIIAVYNRTNLHYINSQTLQAWLGVQLDTPYCDPQIQWDPSAGRWLYAFLFCNFPTSCVSSSTVNCQDIHFGWSKTSDPSNITPGGVNGWCHYLLQTGDQLFDFPKLGHNTNYMMLGVNVFDARGGGTPLGSGALAIKKPANTLHTCPGASTLTVKGSPFPLQNPDNTQAFTPVPVNQTTSALNGYMVSAHDDTQGPQTKLAVWHFDSAGGFHNDSDVTVDTFSPPSPAPQLGSTNTIDTSDGRLTQAVGDPTTGIWTQHTIDGPGGRSIVRWYEIKMSGATALLANEGNIASSTDYVFNGAVSPRTDTGGAAVIYNRSSATIDPVIGAQIRFTSTAAASMEPGEIVLGTSAAADNDFTCNATPCRWGDYSGASPDPVVKNVVWGTSEVTLVPGGMTIAGWGDRNFALAFVTKPLAPTAVTATAGHSSATVSWTPSTYAPTPPTTSYTITAYVGLTPTFTLVVAAPATSANFGGLTDGVTYTFTVFATNSVGSSAESVHSNAVTPGRQPAQAPPPATSTGRPPIVQSTPVPSPTR